jgi:hypothetical protein
MSLRWARGMASFQRDNIVKNSYLVPELEANDYGTYR